MGIKIYIIAGSLDWLSCIAVFPICVKLLPISKFVFQISMFFQIRQVLQVKFYRYHLNIYHQMQKFTNILFQQIYDFFILILLQSRLRMGKININIITNVVADLAFLNCTLYNFSPPFTQQWDSPMAKETDQNDDDWLVTTIEQFDFCPASEQTSIFSNIGSSNLIPRQEFRMGLEGRESSPKSNEQIMMHFCKTQKRSLISVKNFFFLAEKKINVWLFGLLSRRRRREICYFFHITMQQCRI